MNVNGLLPFIFHPITPKSNPIIAPLILHTKISCYKVFKLSQMSHGQQNLQQAKACYVRCSDYGLTRTDLQNEHLYPQYLPEDKYHFQEYNHTAMDPHSCHDPKQSRLHICMFPCRYYCRSMYFEQRNTFLGSLGSKDHTQCCQDSSMLQRYQIHT